MKKLWQKFFWVSLKNQYVTKYYQGFKDFNSFFQISWRFFIELFKNIILPTSINFNNQSQE